MPLTVGSIKTQGAIDAINKIKQLTKREIHDVNTSVPKLFVEKREYMQSDEFLKDSHNEKMFDFIEKLMELRDKIGLEIEEKNKTANDKIVQGINGFSRIKKYLDTNPKMNFSDMQTFHSPVENEYGIVKKYLIGNESRSMKSKLNT